MCLYNYINDVISEAVPHVSATDIPRHLGDMVELLCEEDSQKDTQDPGTMVGGGLMLGHEDREWGEGIIYMYMMCKYNYVF